jgi:hypothetical protein
MTTCETTRGIYLAERLRQFIVVMWTGDGETQINFCPFCGTKVEVKETRRVMLKRIKDSPKRLYEEVTINDNPKPRNGLTLVQGDAGPEPPKRTTGTGAELALVPD